MASNIWLSMPLLMLSELESAMAMIEARDQKEILQVKDSWQEALEEASEILSWPDSLVIQYNPATWRSHHYVVSMRFITYPWDDLTVFEFTTPNNILPFDCLEQKFAKVGVMLHEIGHLVDDARWGIGLKASAEASEEFITGEQRAELFAFACHPVAAFEANLALVESTARLLGIDLGKHSKEVAAIETMGHAGLAGDADPIDVLKGIQDLGVPMDSILEGYLAIISFSMAGLTTVPEMNCSRGLGIKRPADLDRANWWLCQYLRDEMGLEELQEKLMGVDYFAFSEEGHDPLECLDFGYINRENAKENMSRARKYFGEEPCFRDLLRAVEALEARMSLAF
jgi:hypothetical protein